MLRERIEESCARRGLLYPWWVPAVSYAAQLLCVALALVFRDAAWPADPLLLTFVLVLAAPLVEILGRVVLPWPVETIGTALAAAWLFTVPITDGVLDTAPALLALLLAQTVARDGTGPGLAVAAGSVALIAATPFGPALPLMPVHLVDLVLGFVVGAMLRAQMRALAAEREARSRAWQQATTAERERIAREIHDLVAHSLSVTLLHITGARHALRDLREPGADPAAAADEVDAALADAEQVGRRAMADIRRTVSSMADSPASPQALPTAVDIRGLARELAAAGLEVEYEEAGDPAALTQATGLGLYRIAQESLANVAKHAAASSARVRLSVGVRHAHLVVRNALPEPVRRPEPGARGGSGLAGMHARADQLGATLTAGPRDGEWVVDVRVPVERCPLRRSAGTGVHVGDAGGFAEPGPLPEPVAGLPGPVAPTTEQVGARTRT